MRVPGAFVFTAIVLLAGAEAPPVVVVNAGGWTLHGQSLHPRQHLSPLAELEGTPAAGELLLECGLSKGAIVYRCQVPQCHVPVCTTQADGVHVTSSLPNRRETQSPSFFDSFFKRQPSTFAILGVREAGDISDALVSLDGSKLHLAPALKRVLEGKYCISFQSLNSSQSPVQTAALDWDSSVEPEGMVEVPGLVPGLYAVKKGNSGCEFDADAVPAWILVVSSADFPKVSSVWQSYLPGLRELEDSGVGPATVATMRRAVLAELADQYAGK